MKTLRAFALLAALAFLPACGTSIVGPQTQADAAALLDDAPVCDPENPETPNCRGYIGSGS